MKLEPEMTVMRLVALDAGNVFNGPDGPGIRTADLGDGKDLYVSLGKATGRSGLPELLGADPYTLVARLDGEVYIKPSEKPASWRAAASGAPEIAIAGSEAYL